MRFRQQKCQYCHIQRSVASRHWHHVANKICVRCHEKGLDKHLNEEREVKRC